jgi:hypothetical protein
LSLRDDGVGGVTYWAAPARDDLVRVPSPCGSGNVDAGLLFYETPRSMAAKVAYANQRGMKGLLFWTLAQLKDAAGAYPNLEAVRP